MSGCGSLESANHLFFTCNIFSSLWHLVCNWLGFSSVDPSGIVDHFVYLGMCFKISAVNYAFTLVLMWMSCLERKERHDF